VLAPMRRLLSIALLLAACGGKDKELGPTDQAGLRATLDALAGFGEKHAGSPEGRAAADYIAQRFTDMGLSDVHTESFQFPRWELASKAMTITIDGAAMTPGFDVFESSGSGTVMNAPVVNVETATDVDLNGVDLTGKVALVVRDPSFHRAAQFRNVTAHGAVGMLYLSIAPENLRQVGSVRFDWEGAGTIPAITIGADDGAAIKTAVVGGKDVRISFDVAVTSTPGTGQNVIGIIPGEQPDMIVMGAHYDTWFVGSADNGGGVAELLAVAERRMQRPKPHYTLVFVAYDGEEIGLYGGYHYLRAHDVIAHDPIVAVLNFESPSANEPDIAGVVHSAQPALDTALQQAHLRQIYAVYAGLEIVAMLFGGIIPTDIQGTYRSGVPTVTTAVTNNYYHTTEDTPDKVDLQLLADSSDGFDLAIDKIGEHQPGEFAVSDINLWAADVTTTSGAMFAIDAEIRDGTGALQPNITATASVMYDDFFQAATVSVKTDANGHAVFQLPPATITMGSGQRFLHVTAGPTYPLVEKILALP
jgi:Zn-dependent M28 family amino/carboxypeptidase